MKKFTVNDIFEGIISGNRMMLSKGITLIESNLPNHRIQARELIKKCLPHSGKAWRIGVTGVPGAGKSSFLETFGMHLIEQSEQKVAVLAIDPTSTVSGGSILGDKTRMQELNLSESSFIRPSPAGKMLGGVAESTHESIILCEAAGYEVIFVETVGVGQSETTVYNMVDLFLLLLIPGAGDELQGIKRGIVELADLIVVNKSDGERIELAREAVRQYSNALHLFAPRKDGWKPSVKAVSSLKKTGIDNIYTILQSYFTDQNKNEAIANRRKSQALFWLDTYLKNRLWQQFTQSPQFEKRFETLQNAVKQGERHPLEAAEELIHLSLNGNH